MVAGPDLPDGVFFLVLSPRERCAVGLLRGLVRSCACAACGRECLFGSIDWRVARRLASVRGLRASRVCWFCFAGSRFYEGPHSVVRASDFSS
jgi:hypothetical protein